MLQPPPCRCFFLNDDPPYHDMCPHVCCQEHHKGEIHPISDISLLSGRWACSPPICYLMPCLNHQLQASPVKRRAFCSKHCQLCRDFLVYHYFLPGGQLGCTLRCSVTCPFQPLILTANLTPRATPREIVQVFCHSTSPSDRFGSWLPKFGTIRARNRSWDAGAQVLMWHGAAPRLALRS